MFLFGNMLSCTHTSESYYVNQPLTCRMLAHGCRVRSLVLLTSVKVCPELSVEIKHNQVSAKPKCKAKTLLQRTLISVPSYSVV